jgi:hypothetical protein
MAVLRSRLLAVLFVCLAFIASCGDGDEGGDDDGGGGDGQEEQDDGGGGDGQEEQDDG